MGIRATVINATEAVQKMNTIQNTYPIATMLVGRSMVAASLLASQLKENEMVSLYFNGRGPIESVFAEATYEGDVRGYTPHPQLEIPLRDNQLDVSGAIGDGTLSVVRTHALGTQPYRGTVEIQTGEVGDDVAYYLLQSHQIRSVVSLGVKVNPYGRVVSAGGILVELLPDANAFAETIISNRVGEAKSLSESIAAGATNKELLEMYLDGFSMNELKHPYRLQYTCRCSTERLMRSLQLLPLPELDDILKKQETVKAKCEFCGQKYELTHDQTKQIRDEKFRNSLN